MENYQLFLDTLDNDKDMVEIILNMYKEEHGEDTIKIKNYYQSNQLTELFHLTHSLKGVVSNFFEHELCGLLEEIENTSKAGNMPAAELIHSTCKKIETLNMEIDKILIN